jgi:hypothetical protein
MKEELSEASLRDIKEMPHLKQGNRHLFAIELPSKIALGPVSYSPINYTFF